MTTKKHTVQDAPYIDPYPHHAPHPKDRCRHCREERQHHAPAGECLFDTLFFERSFSFLLEQECAQVSADYDEYLLDAADGSPCDFDPE